MHRVSFSFTSITPALIPMLVELTAAQLREKEFSAFAVGMHFPSSFSEDDKALLKKEFQFPFVLELEKKLGKKADFENADVQITVDFAQRVIGVQLHPVYVYGVYTKCSRELAQTMYYCIRCKGRGCVQCGFTGNQKKLSVQEIIAAPCMRAFSAQDNRFHGAGREDVDVQMLGNGREFVLELIEPEKRTVDLNVLQTEINAQHREVQVYDVQFTGQKKIVELKQARHEKVYAALVSCEKKIAVKKLNELVGKEFSLGQRTPVRVAKRRADLVRRKNVVIQSVQLIPGTGFFVNIQAQAGTYVKEFITGDDERTVPSLSALLGVPCICRQLDVVQILR